MIGSFVLMLILVIFTGLIIASLGAAVISFVPALVIFLGEMWMLLFAGALKLIVCVLLLLLIFCCAAVLHLV